MGRGREGRGRVCQPEKVDCVNQMVRFGQGVINLRERQAGGLCLGAWLKPLLLLSSPGCSIKSPSSCLGGCSGRGLSRVLSVVLGRQVAHELAAELELLDLFSE